MKRYVVTLTTIVIWLFMANAQANLIINGSFESSDVATGKWRWFNADQVEGWNGSNIEVWDSLFGFNAFDGEQYIELNAHPFNRDGYSIHQGFNTEVGREYAVRFAYSARQSIQETFRFKLFSSVGDLIDQVISDHRVRQWQQFNARFTADSQQTLLSFTSVNPLNRSVGNLLDDVSVVAMGDSVNVGSGERQAQPVNEPLYVSIIVGFAFLLFRKGMR